MSVVEPQRDFKSCGDFFFFFLERLVAPVRPQISFSRTIEKLGRTLEPWWQSHAIVSFSYEYKTTAFFQMYFQEQNIVLYSGQYGNRFLGSCLEQWYQCCCSQPNFLSAILIFFNNLLFRTPPIPLVWFSPKSNHIIFRPCWLKVMDSVLKDKTIFAYHSNEFEAWCQTDTWGYISAKLWHNDNKLCVCHCHLTQNIPKWFDCSATC